VCEKKERERGRERKKEKENERESEREREMGQTTVKALSMTMRAGKTVSHVDSFAFSQSVWLTLSAPPPTCTSTCVYVLT